MNLPPARLARRVLAAALAAAFSHAPGAAWAQSQVLPSGPTVVNGTADIQLQGSGERMVIANSANAILNWNAFSIGRENTVQFIQPSANSKVLNRVTGNDPSNIMGSLQSNGQVWLVNPNGVLFGADARVDVGALVASTLAVSNQNFLDGRLAFGNAGAPAGQVVNQGTLSTSFGGHVWLIGASVRNQRTVDSNGVETAPGIVNSPGGQIVLAAGRSIDLVDSGAPNVTVRVSAPGDGALNLGQLLAPGGSIDLHGAIVNQQGIVRAGSLEGGSAGRILIRASGDVMLADGSETSADGGYDAAGGQVVVESVGGTSTIRGSVSATGAGQAGGQIHLLGRAVSVDTGAGAVDASGTGGGGEILIGTAQAAANPAVPDANAVRIEVGSHIRANATTTGNGGSIVVRSGGSTEVRGSLEATAGPSGGQGGRIETAGAFVDARPSALAVGAAKGDGGSWLLTANNVAVVDATCPLCGQTPAAEQETVVSNALVRQVLEQGGRVRLEAGSPGAPPQTGNLRVTAGIFVPQAARPGAGLVLAAQNDLVANGAVDIGSTARPLPVTLIADLDHSGAGALRLDAGTRVFTGGADLVMGGDSTGYGTAQRISLTGNTLDAGTGTLSLTASAVDIGADSHLYGGVVAVAGGALALEDSTVLARVPGRSGLIEFSGNTVDLARAQLIVEGRARITGVSAISLDNTMVSAEEQGDAIVLSTARLAGTGSRLAAPDGRWLAYLDTLEGFSPTLFDTLGYTFVQAGAGTTAAPALSGRGANGVIVRAPMDVRVQVDATRVYDGTTQATFSTALASDLAPAFALQAGDGIAQGRFADKNVGTGKLVAIDGASAPFAIVTATGQPVYGANQTYVADITPRPLSASLAAANKVYDATRTATVSGSLSGAIAGDDIRLDGVTGLFDTRDAGTGKTVTLTRGTLRGADAGNYLLDSIGSALADITPRPISSAGITALDKVYDGTRTAGLSGSLSGVLAGDTVGLGGTALFDDRNAGVNKTVSLSGASLAGADAGNYALTSAGTLQASITPRPISSAGITALDKVYDGTRTAGLSGNLSGVLAGDTVSLGGTALFDDRNAGLNKTVSISGASLAGAGAGNYALASAGTLQASITPRPISSAGITALDKVYDGNRSATLSGSLSGILAGDAVSLGGATALFDDRNAGANKTVSIAGATLAGADAGNYALTGASALQASITPRPLAPTSLQALDKVYDGNRTAAVSGSLAGIVAGDTVSLDLAGQFDTKDAGAAKTVALTGALAGADAANYSVALPASLSAAIARRPLEIVLAGDVSKEYDATAQASLAPGAFRLDGVLPGETLSIRGPAQASFATPDVGRDKPVSAAGAFEIGGADAANYRIGTTGLTGPSNIIQAAVSGNVGTITPATLVYEAFPAAAIGGLAIGPLGGTVTGFKGGDTLATATSGNVLWQGTATPASKPGAYAVVGSGLTAANYRFVQAPGNATALDLKAGVAAEGPPQRALDGSVLAMESAIHAALPTVALPVISAAVFDRSGATPAKAFAPVRLGAMDQDEIGRMLAERKDFKRKLFADAIYKLAIDPSLADVRPCARAADAASGTCRITPEQVAALQAAARVAAPATHGATARVASLPQIERKIAVLFGINDYADKDIPQLFNAIPDADAVARVFAGKLGYEVRVVHNPDKAEIVRVLNGLAAEAGSADSVVVYYAGHGYSMENNGAGYWLGADARVTDPKTWISNGDIAHLLSGIRSKQVALISDSCYSGAFTRDGVGAIGKNVMAATVDNVLAKRSVVVLSSGGDEPVPDEGKNGHSIFTWNLIQVIGSVQDWKPGSTIFSSVRANVRKEFPQTPKYGSLTAAGHQAGGEYLFESRSN